MVWAPDMHAVASASDDRSVMLWPLPDLAQAAEQRGPAPVSASRVLTGHQARLWDITFCGELIITASEDCTCRSGVRTAQHCSAHSAIMAGAQHHHCPYFCCIRRIPPPGDGWRILLQLWHLSPLALTLVLH